jgi:hypothetical protein
MGFGLPAAMDVKMVHPDDDVLCSTGEGPIQMFSRQTLRKTLGGWSRMDEGYLKCSWAFRTYRSETWGAFEAPDQTHLTTWFETLTACEGPLSIEYLRYFQSDAALVKNVAGSAKSDACSPAHIAVLGMAHDDVADWPLSDVETINILSHAVVSRDKETAPLAALCLLRMAHAGSQTATKAFVAALLLRIAQRVREPDDVDKSLTIASQKYGVLEEVLSSCMRKTRNVTDGIVVEVDLLLVVKPAARGPPQ